MAPTLLSFSPEAALEREIQEETGWDVKAGPLIDGGVWIYQPIPGRRVLIVTYGCHTSTDAAPVVSNEHKEVGLFTAAAAAALRMPDGYKKSIAAWYAQTSNPAV